MKGTVTDAGKLTILAGWLMSSKNPHILTRLDHILVTESGRKMVVKDLLRMAKVMQWLNEEEHPIFPGDTMYDYFLEQTEERKHELENRIPNTSDGK